MTRDDQAKSEEQKNLAAQVYEARKRLNMTITNATRAGLDVTASVIAHHQISSTLFLPIIVVGVSIPLKEED